MTKIKMWNTTDEDKVREGIMNPEAARSVEVEGMVDTGAVTLAIPDDVASRLGLPVIAHEPATLADGRRIRVPVVSSLRIEILGRTMSCDAFVLPAGTTPLIGQIPLERLDLVVDPRSREARPNPAHPDGPEFYILRAA